ncbi:MAG: hypothetical protein II610_07585 [Treponema sp.]|nr:hypothetical protein [Treponema sp.]MBR3544266.1 hypothetical protein [Treponema sp.]
MNSPNFSLSYSFSCEELKALSALFRDGADKIPISLYNFSRAVQEKVYDCMSIAEFEEGLKNESGK